MRVEECDIGLRGARSKVLLPCKLFVKLERNKAPASFSHVRVHKHTNDFMYMCTSIYVYTSIDVYECVHAPDLDAPVLNALHCVRTQSST